MKKTFSVFLFFVMLSCGSISKKERELEWQRIIENKTTNQNFTVEIPSSWVQALIHEDVNYSPKEAAKLYYNCRLYIRQLYPINNPSLIDFAEKQLSTIYNLNPQEIRKTSITRKSKIGDLYIYDSNDYTSMRSYNIYFIQDGNFYMFRYSSVKILFDKYLPKAVDILASFKLK